MNDQPLVSIVIPVYNGGNYLTQAIDSALNQTYENIEIIVVNDGSCDDGETERIALSYGDKIRYFSKENGGVSTALNLGISQMKGEYFSWLSHDDKYAPTKIENQVELLKKYNNEPKLIAMCATIQINKDSAIIGKQEIEKKYIFQKLEWEQCLMNFFRGKGLNGCSLLIPKLAFQECGTFDERLRYTQDAFMWVKMFLNGYSLVYENVDDSMMRIHNGQLTQTGIKLYHKDSETMSEFLIPELVKISNKNTNFLFLYAKHNAKYHNSIVWKNCLKEGSKHFNFIQRLQIRIIALYGKVRPFIRKVYYRIFKKVKTN